ncbi:thioredoxin family protein [Geminisphaera colitermitum]|uniref:thioredoxin family protein n=1 Tax=Geminisphaera colitermitum TaxID=1148786 RepID=UPI000158C668|nr:thioredoxin family protein [Geminisphaera colitermitum]
MTSKTFLPTLAFAATLIALMGCSANDNDSTDDHAPAQVQAIWLTDYPAAVQQAAAEKKRLLLDFTGSDWCHWCIQLDKEVFSRKAFVDYATQNLVLVKLDFPADKPQSDALKEQNMTLARKYEVQGFPTIVVLDSSEKELGMLGYQPGGPKKWIESLEKLTGPANSF